MEPRKIIVNGKIWWERDCPECGKTIRHTKGYNARKFIKAGSLCKPCSKLGKRNSFYGKSHTEEMKRHYSKLSSGKNNSMYGIGGMLGKHHSEETKQKISKYHIQRWKKLGANPTEFERYRNRVDSITRTQPIHLLEDIEKRGRAGVDGAYHLDHVVSVWIGFQKNISPEEIANISNLRMLPWLENQKKWMK